VTGHRARVRTLFVLASTGGALAALLFGERVGAVEHNFAGSAQFDYALVATDHKAQPTGGAFDGATTEVALKLAVDVSDAVSVNVKVCYGCHGFEVPLAHFDYRIADELNFRIGRFSPSLGAFNLRHDPANHKFSDKPLIYDMGRMLRLRDWNLGVVPSPFPDNGVEVNGTHWFGESTQADYAVYAITGFRGTPQGQDLDWTLSRSTYYVDNNSRPAVGARLSMTTKFGPTGDATFGISGQRGTYDKANAFNYAIFGADLALRVGRTAVRAEYLARRQTFDTTDPNETVFKYDVASSRGDFFLKHGVYVEIETPVSPQIDFLARLDAMFRSGNVLKTSAIATTEDRASVTRLSLGATYLLDRALRLKGSVEGWHFSDPADPPDAGARQRWQNYALSLHLGVVGTY
jgi:hypothetical protein